MGKSIIQISMCYKFFTYINQIEEGIKAEMPDVKITVKNCVTLKLISENPGITQNELAALNFKNTNVISKLVDKLEKEKYVKRKKSDDDRRAYLLYTTPKGEEVVAEYTKIAQQVEDKYLNRLTSKEKDMLNTIGSKIIK